ncbi:diguanylate cyclase [Alginatibacterium sediminis]|uniref:diguanylate cyclase n=2 Tax=Alginatibacterium sediminis TaxID=2164068 RepID=A0A420E9B1_9ALTE|nr:diguanylate cyclase [Alginatibacterium sediminis]
MVHTIDAGLMVIDKQARIQVWNSFMENHSGFSAQQVSNKQLFDVFPDLARSWLERKIETVFKLRTPSFTTWEQRPFVFEFGNYRPLTGKSAHMYQNMTMIPLNSVSGDVDHLCIIIYDVSDVANSQLQLADVNQELKVLSRTDRLTGLFNRGYWEEQLSSEFNRFKRTQKTSTLVMFDIDHFKAVNDNYGHHVGDEVIKVCSFYFQQCARNTDVVGRYGGEEFGAILIDTDAQQAMFFCERLRKKIAEHRFELQGFSFNITISLGICESDPGMLDHTQWIQGSDKALYTSKESGRNLTSSIRFSELSLE